MRPVAAIFVCLLAACASQDHVRIPHDTPIREITEQERQAAVDVLDAFAAGRTRIPPSPEAYLATLARDERMMLGGDSSFLVGYERLAGALDAPEKLLPGWVTEFDLVVRDHDIRRLADGVLMYTAHYDERIVDTSGAVLEVEGNVMHGTLVRQDGAWKILSMATAHSGASEEAIAAFFERNMREDG